ncbi:MAG: SRPBCC family protein [Cyanobacteria bacterium P01_F01_bin.86]
MKVFRFLFWQQSSPSGQDNLAQTSLKHPFNQTYQTLSSASVETLWQVLTNIGDVSWHPLLNSTNAPQGLTAKPGLIYRVVPRWFPIPIRIFVERVLPQELLSVRMFPIPGLEERITYRLESTGWGTRISYSIMVRGWLSPVAWSVLKPCAAHMASAIAKAAEK